jgi:hypothetical protein
VKSGRSLKLITHLHLVRRLRMRSHSRASLWHYA